MIAFLNAACIIFRNFTAQVRQIGMEIVDSLCRWLRDEVERANARGIVLGLSGGVDSAVVAALGNRALGKNVLALIMPCHSLKKDGDDAREVANLLKVKIETVDLGGVYDTLTGCLPRAPKYVTANLKPRLRMLTLYHYARLLNYLVAGTGNKSEISVGYFTKHGDGGVDIFPLGDLYKWEVRSIARNLGRIVTRTPSAGLFPGQTDEQELGISYEELDRTIACIEGGAGIGMKNDPLVAKVSELMKNSLHKRAPIPVFRKGTGSGS